MVKFLKKNLIEFIIISFALLFSTWLMWHTFSYQDGSMLIATKAWSDFASHIPLIRSFSLGNNFPPEYPLFPGEPIRYHFIFYAFVGFLEKMGFRIDYALNIPSTFSFALLIIIIYFFAKILFNSKKVALLSVVFFLFNGSLSFLEFFKTHPLPLNSITDITSTITFPSFGPYDGKIVSAFWNLNIYTNQRHLALAFGLSLCLLYFLLKQDKQNTLTRKDISIYLALGLLLGFSFFLHLAVFMITLVMLGSLFLFFPSLRLKIFIIALVTAIISLPQYLILKGQPGQEIKLFNPGYLIIKPITLIKFIDYWFNNLGLHLLFIPLGFILAPKNAKKIFIGVFLLFIIGNLFQFSPEIAANHKFFNYFMIFGVMFSAYFFINLWKVHTVFKPLVLIFIILLTLSGIIDFFPIKNDSIGNLLDYPKNPDIAWIMKNTPRNAKFLNSSYLYHPASLAGRKIFLGWPYFAWSQGYNTTKRYEKMKIIISSNDKNAICNFLIENNLSYVSLSSPDPDFPFNREFWRKNFIQVYNNPISNFTFYNVKNSCYNYINKNANY